MKHTDLWAFPTQDLFNPLGTYIWLCVVHKCEPHLTLVRRLHLISTVWV